MNPDCIDCGCTTEPSDSDVVGPDHEPIGKLCRECEERVDEELVGA